jgi:Na+-transporting NADH:ubiquinone oxidoreductase subunit NqrF
LSSDKRFAVSGPHLAPGGNKHTFIHSFQFCSLAFPGLHDNYLSKHDDPTEIEYYLCGPPMMVDAIEDMLDSLGVEPEMIAYDKF